MSKLTQENGMLCDIQYIRENKREKTPDTLYIIWKDIDTEEKQLMTIEEPKVEIYFEKDEFRDHTYNKNHQLKDRCNKVTVKYRDIIFRIADDMGDQGKQFLANVFSTQNYNRLKELLIYPYVYGADYEVDVWYRNYWFEKYNNSRPKPITKGFLDIEVDSLEAIAMPDPKQCPVDLVTLIDDSCSKSYTFCLLGVDCVQKNMDMMTPKQRQKELDRRELYANRLVQQEAFKNDINKVKEECHKMFDETYGDIDYNFYLYTDERKMLAHIFQLVHKLKLDFISIWNMEFDIPYLKERMEYLGMNAKEIMCHPDFKVKQCYFKKDTRHFEIKNQSNYFHVSSYTVWVDQMRNYAAIRKGRSELRSNRLTYIAKKELNDEKLDLADEGNIKTISYKNYLRYVLYNIKDVLLQKGIEKRTSDIENLYASSYKNITPYSDIFKQTRRLRNVQYRTFMDMGLVPGENINGYLYNLEDHDNDDNDDPTFEGALVGDPRLNGYFGVPIYDKKSNSIFNFSIDMDMGAFYPNTIIELNIDASTLIFKVIVDGSQFVPMGGNLPVNGITTKVNPIVADKVTPTLSVEIDKKTGKMSFVDVGKEIFDNFQTKNYVSTLHKWCNFPSIEQIYKRLKKELG